MNAYYKQTIKKMQNKEKQTYKQTRKAQNNIERENFRIKRF